MHCTKECDESMYWLELLKVRDYLPEDEFKSIHEQSNDVKNHSQYNHHL
jgi:hypothetical protein